MPHSPQDKTELMTQIQEDLKSCVHCGICLSACPTYLTTGNEGQSPRGRLYLIQDQLSQDQPSNNSKNQSIKYLDACLSCQACESVCPSGVDYSKILESARRDFGLSNYSQGLWASLRKFIFRYLLPNRSLLNSLRLSLRLINGTKLIPLIGHLIPLAKLSPRLTSSYKTIRTGYIYSNRLVTKKPFHTQQENLNTTENRPIVSLPLGCLMDTLYNKTHWDTIKVLNALGFDVYIPPSNCCGSLASHSNEHDIGDHQCSETLYELAKQAYPVVMNSAGCSAHLKHNASKHNSTTKILDFIEILAEAPVTLEEFSKLLHNPSPLKITYHAACHLHHAQKLPQQDYLDLLKLIPNIEILPLREADICCGSAGFYNIIQPNLAKHIGERKAQNIAETGAEILVSANPGCLSQIQAYSDIEVIHPISLLGRFLQQSPALVSRYYQPQQSAEHHHPAKAHQ